MKYISRKIQSRKSLVHDVMSLLTGVMQNARLRGAIMISENLGKKLLKGTGITDNYGGVSVIKLHHQNIMIRHLRQFGLQIRQYSKPSSWLSSHNGISKGVDNRGAEGAKAPPDF